jgi:hypothetical protein
MIGGLVVGLWGSIALEHLAPEEQRHRLLWRVKVPVRSLSRLSPGIGGGYGDKF